MEQIVPIQSEILFKWWKQTNKKMSVGELTVSLPLPGTCDDEGRRRASDEAAGSLPGAQRHWWETREESTSSTVPRGVRETKQGYLSSLGVFLLILIIQWGPKRGHWWDNEDGGWSGLSPLNKCRWRASPGPGTKLGLFAIWKSSVKNESRVCSSPTWVSLWLHHSSHPAAHLLLLILSRPVRPVINHISTRFVAASCLFKRAKNIYTLNIPPALLPASYLAKVMGQICF